MIAEESTSNENDTDVNKLAKECDIIIDALLYCRIFIYFKKINIINAWEYNINL
jgi:hypothetical protein